LTSEHKIVSSEAEELILVDADDRELGFMSKARCHDGDGVLHRAFSVFLFSEDGRLLLQQRSRSKRLWGGYWSNTCCSHPRRGETMNIATGRRLQDELGISADLEFVYKFSYQARFDESGSENELCYVYLGTVTTPAHPNEHEIEAIRYVSAAELQQELDTAAEQFSPWFRIEWETLLADHRELLEKYC
jgi:isopentenyl-diphosphate delta-isomerase